MAARKSKKHRRPVRTPDRGEQAPSPTPETPIPTAATPSPGPLIADRPAGSTLQRQAMIRPDWRISALVLLLCAAVYVPLLGEYGMYDPWETIYTEVGRQFMERDEWLSPYWHNGTGPEGYAETNFWSKPVGSFWLSGLSLRLSGLRDRITLRGTGRSLADPALTDQTGPDPGAYLANHSVEWAVRIPFFLCGLFGIFCIYLMCTRLFGRRAGVLSALVLATSPIYFFIARQAMTDMPYVGLMSGGLALFALAIFGEDLPLARKRIALGKREFSWPHTPSYYVFICSYLFLFALMMQAIVPPLLRMPIPGLPAVSRAVWLLLYVAAAAAFIWMSRKTKTQNEIYLYIFYGVTGIAGLSKGLIGALQPGFIILVYLLASREWRILSQAALGRGILLAVTVFAPWWHAMVLRHGMGFWNELVGTEQMRRLTVGEQKQAKGTWEYYIRQVGYGLFPWVAFLPAALLRAFGIGVTHERTAADRARLFCYLWFAATMLLFSLTLTKYHHYILPAIPPAAIIIGLYLDDLLARRTRGVWLALLGAAVVLAVVAVDLVAQPANWVWMFTYLYSGNWARGVPEATPILYYALACGGALALAFVPKWRKTAIWGLLAISIGGGGYVLNWYQVKCSHHWGQKYVMQTYYKVRKGPEEQLIAWQFNWRGETWYTAAQVVVAKSLDNKKIQDWLRERKGRRFFFITERGRYPSLRNMLPTAKGRETLRIVDDANVHFVLAEAQI